MTRPSVLFMLLLPTTSRSSIRGIFFVKGKLFRRVEFGATRFTSKTTFFLVHSFN
jgi:hypothetical protein